MDLKTYKKKQAEIKDEYTRKLYSLNMQFAAANNTVKKGDVVTDGKNIILAEEIRIPSGTVPFCTYYGPTCGPRGEVLEDSRPGVIHQENMEGWKK